MRRRFAVIGLCLAALVTTAAVSVASAAATEPALYECAKASKETVKYKSGTKEKSKSVYTGKYTEKKCVTLAPAGKYRAEGKPEGKYELQEGIGKGKAFKGKSKGANLEAAGVGGVACGKGGADTGKFNTPKTAADIVATFKGCELNGKKCESAGQAVGTIVTFPLKGEVGYLAGKGGLTPTMGADIKPESGELLAEFDCTPDVFAVTGSVISEIEPVNEFSKEATFTFKQSEKIGEQLWTKFEGGSEDVLTSHVCPEACAHPLTEGSPAASAEETVFVNKGEELMLKA